MIGRRDRYSVAAASVRLLSRNHGSAMSRTVPGGARVPLCPATARTAAAAPPPIPGTGRGGAHTTLTAGFDLPGQLRAEVGPQGRPYAIACGPFPGSQSLAPRSRIQLGAGTSSPVRLSQRTYCLPMRSSEQFEPYDEAGMLAGCGSGRAKAAGAADSVSKRAAPAATMPIRMRLFAFMMIPQTGPPGWGAR